MRVLVLHKDKLDKPRWFELPTGFVFHIGNACEDLGVIRLDCIRSPSAWNATTGLKGLMLGRYEPHEHPAMVLMQFDSTSGRAKQSLLPQIAEFPRSVLGLRRTPASRRPGRSGLDAAGDAARAARHFRPRLSV